MQKLKNIRLLVKEQSIKVDVKATESKTYPLQRMKKLKQVLHNIDLCPP